MTKEELKTVREDILKMCEDGDPDRALDCLMVLLGYDDTADDRQLFTLTPLLNVAWLCGGRNWAAIRKIDEAYEYYPLDGCEGYVQLIPHPSMVRQVWLVVCRWMSRL